MPDPVVQTPAATPAAASPPVASASPAAPAAPAAAAASLLSPAPASALEVPDKFKVTKQDGTIDHEATLQKALGGYTYLEKRFGTGDVPPENEAGYKLDYSAFPEGVKISPEGEKAFLKSMHSAGLTNKQVQAVVNKYGEVIKAGQELMKQQETGRAQETLKGVADELAQVWGANNDANIKAASRGFNHLADEADRKDIAKIGVDARVTYRILMKVLAKVGAGITEDTQINADSAGIDASLEELKNSKAYTDENDPQHKATVAKVTALYQRRYPKK